MNLLLVLYHSLDETMVLFKFGVAGQTNDFRQWIVAGKLKILVAFCCNFSGLKGEDGNLHLSLGKH